METLRLAETLVEQVRVEKLEGCCDVRTPTLMVRLPKGKYKNKEIRSVTRVIHTLMCRLLLVYYKSFQE